MLENVITRLSMDPLRPNLGGHITSCPDMSPTIRLPWQRPLPSNGALNILQSWGSGGRTRKPILIKFGMQQQVRTVMTVMRSNIIFFYNSKWRTAAMLEIHSKCHNSPINGPTETQLVTSHHVPDMSPTIRLPWQRPLPSNGALNILQL